jgi:UDP-N-acetylglucosamine 2-epimerase
VTLREETEWVETVETGWNVLAGSDADMIVSAARRMPGLDRPRPPIYGDGKTAERIVAAL